MKKIVKILLLTPLCFLLALVLLLVFRNAAAASITQIYSSTP
jgi:hypothetical protein